jgi:hypothetical protein
MNNIKSIFWSAIAVNVLACGAVASVNISRNVSSQQASSARSTALLNIAKHVMSDTCWKSPQKTSFKVGDPITTNGTTTGKIPTSCMYAPKSKQFLEIGYIDQELVVVRVFSIKEVQAGKSIIKDRKSWL